MEKPAEDDFGEVSARFMSWLHKRGASVNPKISLTDLRSQDAGRGVVALEDIELHEELFALQLADLSLVLVLMYEYGQGEQSAWHPYLDILPARFNTLAVWTPQELEELQGSAVVKRIYLEEADEAFKSRLLPIVKVHPDIFGKYAPAFRGPDAESVLLKLAHTMSTLMMAYGFDLEAKHPDTDSEDRESQDHRVPKGMIPLADMLNADGDYNNAHLVQQATSMHMIAVIAMKPIEKGEEIFNDYGDLPRSDLLRKYGYITDRYEIWDFVEVDSKLIVRKACEFLHMDEAAKTKRSKLAKQWEADEDAFDITRHAASKMSALDPTLIAFLEVMSMSAKTLDFVIKGDYALVNSELTLKAAQLLTQVLTERRNDYETTIAEDVVLLRDNALPKRHRMAIGVRLGEKEIIATALSTVQNYIAKVQSEDEAYNDDELSQRDADGKTDNGKKRKI